MIIRVLRSAIINNVCWLGKWQIFQLHHHFVEKTRHLSFQEYLFQTDIFTNFQNSLHVELLSLYIVKVYLVFKAYII